jgi:hypothetical protein
MLSEAISMYVKRGAFSRINTAERIMMVVVACFLFLFEALGTPIRVFDRSFAIDTAELTIIGMTGRRNSSCMKKKSHTLCPTENLGGKMSSNDQVQIAWTE